MSADENLDGPTEAPSSSSPARRRRVPIVPAISSVAVAAFIGLLAYGVFTSGTSSAIDDRLNRAQATPAPDFKLALLQRGGLGRILTPKFAPAASDRWIALRELRGTPVVLNIWASWCVPCREEAPVLQRAWVAARPRGILFLGLNQQDVTDDAHAFLHNFKVDYPNIRDPSDDVPRRFGATGLPETYFLSATGNVVGHVIGVVTPSDLKAGTAAAVAGRPHPLSEGGARRPSR